MGYFSLPRTALCCHQWDITYIRITTALLWCKRYRISKIIGKVLSEDIEFDVHYIEFDYNCLSKQLIYYLCVYYTDVLINLKTYSLKFAAMK